MTIQSHDGTGIIGHPSMTKKDGEEYINSSLPEAHKKARKVIVAKHDGLKMMTLIGVKP